MDAENFKTLLRKKKKKKKEIAGLSKWNEPLSSQIAGCKSVKVAIVARPSGAGL